jgi:hypothetical protein
MKLDLEESNKNAALVILAIIALAGLGLGGYSFYELQKEGNLQVILIPPEGSKVVGLWTNLSRFMYGSYNTSNWLVGVNNTQILKSDYVSLSNNNTNVTLQKTGWYKLHLSLVLVNLTLNNEYYINFNRNNSLEYSLAKFNSTGTTYRVINLYQFIHFNSSDFFEINCNSSDSFNLGTTDLYQNYNQMSIEYIFSLYPW